jgi:hypothetical protein
MHTLVRAWAAHKLDLVAVQETWATLEQRDAAQAQLAGASEQQKVAMWRVLAWGPGVHNRGGTAILARAALVASGALRVEGPPLIAAAGDLSTLRLSWAGHVFWFASVYMLAGGQHDQARSKFVELHLGPLSRKGGMQIRGLQLRASCH